MKQWYTLHTKTSTEQKVALLLEQHGIETYLPEIAAAKAGSKPVPFFPGYMFVHCDLGLEDPAHWKWTPGLRYIVSYGAWPVPVPDQVINMIEYKLGELETHRSKKPAHNLSPGDVVRINNGPFRDMLAVFDGPTTPSERVSVLLSGISGSVRLRISSATLEKVSEPANSSVGSLVTIRQRRTRGRGRRIS